MGNWKIVNRKVSVSVYTLRCLRGRRLWAPSSSYVLLAGGGSMSRPLELLKKWQANFSLVFFCQGIVKRDEIVFRAARRRGIPILMVTSGGYQKKTARIIADSILNLHQQGLIGAEALEGEGSSSLVTSMMCTSGSVGSKFTSVWDVIIWREHQGWVPLLSNHFSVYT